MRFLNRCCLRLGIIKKNSLNIQNSLPQDIHSIFRLYRIASDYQRSKFVDNVWPDFSPELVAKEIQEKRQFKLTIDGKIACVWAVTFSDPEIWGDKDKDAAIYIHRIATDPDCRGNNLVEQIVRWAKPYARSCNKDFIRLDTCGHNEGLIKHYTKNGFVFLGISKMTDPGELPSHYHDAEVCYFEMKLI